MPALRLGQFSHDIQRARDILGLGQSIGNMTHGLVDSSDLYRFALVQAVAAMDTYVHGVVLDRGLDILLGRISPGTATKVGLPFHAVSEVLNAPSAAEQELRARTHLAQRLTQETYQRPDAIGSALAMVGVQKVWASAFPGSGQAKSAMTALGVIVQRRNRIVHQSDADPLTPGSITPLSAQDALDAIATVEVTVAAIDVHC